MGLSDDIYAFRKTPEGMAIENIKVFQNVSNSFRGLAGDSIYSHNETLQSDFPTVHHLESDSRGTER